jgi:hypothetical protein
MKANGFSAVTIENNGTENKGVRVRGDKPKWENNGAPLKRKVIGSDTNEQKKIDSNNPW